MKISHEGKNCFSGISESGSIFTIFTTRDTGEVSNLLTYEFFFFRDDYGKKCGFDRDPENIPILEGDVLNIFIIYEIFKFYCFFLCIFLKLFISSSFIIKDEHEKLEQFVL